MYEGHFYLSWKKNYLRGKPGNWFDTRINLLWKLKFGIGWLTFSIGLLIKIFAVHSLNQKPCVTF